MNGPSACASLALKGSARRFLLGEGQTWAIGRGDGCAVMLDSRSVSRLHALIQRRDAGDYWLVDLGSRNGSFVNGHRVSVPVVLHDASRLVFGDQELMFLNPLPTAEAAPDLDTSTRGAPTTSLHTHALTTIVVVDIRDFTPLARSLPESLLSQALGKWFLRTGQIAQRLGSWGQRYIGDAVMAVWVHEERTSLAADLVRALRAVSEIDAATSQIGRELPLPEPLRIGAGVNTGLAIVGGTDFTALGDSVNVAFRLEGATKELGMGVALGERTFQELGLPVPEPFTRREVILKGYDAPSTAWAVSFEGLREFVRTRRA